MRVEREREVEFSSPHPLGLPSYLFPLLTSSLIFSLSLCLILAREPAHRLGVMHKFPTVGVCQHNLMKNCRQSELPEYNTILFAKTNFSVQLYISDHMSRLICFEFCKLAHNTA